MVKIGIIGKGDCILAQIEKFRLIRDVEVSGILSTDHHELKNLDSAVYDSFDELRLHSDAIILLETDESPFELVQASFRHGKHVFIEQISLMSVVEIEQLLNSRKEANVKCAIGSSELSHPAFLAIKKEIKNPIYIESQRSIQYDNSHTKHIILNVMLKDLAVILSTVESDIKRIWASGFKVMNRQMDKADVKLEFLNGCVASLRVNMCGMKEESEIIFCEQNKILAIDFQNTQVSTTTKQEKGQSVLSMVHLPLDPSDPFIFQIENFRDIILLNIAPLMKLREGYEKLNAAHKILKKMNSFTEE